VGIERLC